MTTAIAGRFYELAISGDFAKILHELFDQNAVSTEPPGSPFLSVKGLENIIKKGDDFHVLVEEMHNSYISMPLIAGHYFTCAMGMDVTLKGMGRKKFEEIALYAVQNGKIISEQFFF